MHQTGKLLDYLTEELSEHKEQIIKHNKHCKDNVAFLSNTYSYGCIIEENLHLITTYRDDLPAFYRDLILNKIKEFFKENNLNVEYSIDLYFRN